jgi:hypothetical protein
MKKIAISSLLASVLLLNFVACGSSSTKKVYINNSSDNLKETSDSSSSSSNTGSENIEQIRITDVKNFAIDLGAFDAEVISGNDSDKFKIVDGDVYTNDNISNGEYIITISAKNPDTNKSASIKLKVIVDDSSLKSADSSNQSDNSSDAQDNNSSTSTLSISDFTKIEENNSNGDQNRVTQTQAKNECESQGMRLPTFDELNSILNVNNISQIADFDSDGDSSIQPNSFTSVIWSSEPNTGLWFKYDSNTSTITPQKFDGADETSKYYYTCVPK